MNDHWDHHARQWKHIGPPLRPDSVDISHVERLLEKVAISQAVLLGVTPELASMRWPSGTKLAAVDRNPGMVAHIWPRETVSVPAVAVLGEWERLPIGTNSVDVVVGMMAGQFLEHGTRAYYVSFCWTASAAAYFMLKTMANNIPLETSHAGPKRELVVVIIAVAQLATIWFVGQTKFL